MNKKTVCVSGGFDPLHIGHIELLKKAALHGDLVVIINSDEWLIRKKGFTFLPWEQRAAIIKDLEYVSEVVTVDDSDDTVCEALRRIKPTAFANGGDRKPNTTPEVVVCKELGIEMLWEIGGGKVESSSEIATRAWVQRDWGKYLTLDEGKDYKVKKLILDPGKAISLQYHEHRKEFWYIAESKARVEIDNEVFEIEPGEPPVVVENGSHHQLENIGATPLTVIEIQYGEYMGEDDIFRPNQEGK